MQLSELAVGASAEMSRTVTDADVMMYAGLTGDYNPVHVDAEAAAQSMFKGRIAHGMLSAGYISAVLAMKLPGAGAIYLGQSLKFTKPVRLGDTITARVEIVEIIAAKKRVRLATTCRNQHGETVLDGEATVMVPDG